MSETNQRVRRGAPSWLMNRLRKPGSGSRADLPSYAYLQELMRRYRTDRLVGVSPAEFRKRIDEFLQLDDYSMEGFAQPDKQRDLTIRFHWGHDHDFGEFALRGRMQDRHLSLIATFIDQLDAIPRDLSGKSVLDLGAWTGGTSLLLSAMGANVVAIEEVRKYVECLEYLQRVFDVQGLSPHALSLFECSGPEFEARFDVVLFAGVLYHVTDPVLALRIVFNALKPGGVCLVETAVCASRDPTLVYEGPSEVTWGSAKNRSRAGWNWFIPSSTAVHQMMIDVGFSQVRALEGPGDRAYFVGTKLGQVDMLRAGLSARHVS